jgi:hypothetical protein
MSFITEAKSKRRRETDVVSLLALLGFLTLVIIAVMFSPSIAVTISEMTGINQLFVITGHALATLAYFLAIACAALQTRNKILREMQIPSL